MKFQAKGTKIIVKLLPDFGNVTKSGIVLKTEVNSGMTLVGEVVSVGEEVSGTSVGEIIIVPRSSCIDIQVLAKDGESFGYVEAKNIICTVEEE